MQKQIGIFKLYNKRPNNIKHGHLYECLFNIDEVKYSQERMVRVFLPQGYNQEDTSKRYRVIYMADGQNCVDSYLSAYGEWNIDEHIHALGVDLIVVGIDCPKVPMHRSLELCPPYKPKRFDEVPYCDQYGEFIFKRLKPIIDSTFNTLQDRESTAIGGSSMGGISSFYLGYKFKEYVGFSLCFSPAFLLYTQKETLKLLEDINVYEHDPIAKRFLYVGGRDFEERFVKNTFLVYNTMMKRDMYNHDNLKLLYDSTELHHESAWSKYFSDAIRFWYGIN